MKSDPSKNKPGKAYKGRRDSEYKCFEAHDGVLYRPGDHVFIEVSQCEPYFIGTISNFKMVCYFALRTLSLNVFNEFFAIYGTLFRCLISDSLF